MNYVPLWSVDFALDTETDRWDGGPRRTVLVQACPITATGLKDVRYWHGLDAWRQFMALFEETKGKKLKCHCYNLGGFEQVSIIKDALKDYEFTREKTPQPGQWSMLGDRQTIYKISVKNTLGCILEFTDDMRRVGGASMKDTATAIRAEHPEYWDEIPEVKESSDYADGWLHPSNSNFSSALHYSILDAFSQAMITRFLVEKGYDRKLTAPSLGLEESLSVRYRGKHANECDDKERHFNIKDFQRYYPPLDRRMQDIAESSLLGGFVWGETGEWHGTFCHADYSSSYPFEYVYGNLFYGRVSVLTPSDRAFLGMMDNQNVFKWYLVSFDFNLIPGRMPCISGRDAVHENRYLAGRANLKMSSGHVENRLFTSSYFEELQKHYNLSNVTISEIWYAKRRTGDFAPVIKEFYDAKTKLKNEGLDDTIGYRLNKLFMNGGIHGKTITKTHRERRLWDAENERFCYEKEENEPNLCFLIGFTAMMNARERLLRDCRTVIEHGYKILMCDTDSMVVNTDADTLRSVLGTKKLVTGPTMAESLGKFDIETDRKGLKKAGLLGQVEVSENFDIFKCWGLKRYCEIRTVPGLGRLYRKSAFAGMHDESQTALMDIPVSYEFVYEWTQKGKRTGQYCAEILDTKKHMCAMDVWYHGKDNNGKVKDLNIEAMKALCQEVYDIKKELGEI